MWLIVISLNHVLSYINHTQLTLMCMNTCESRRHYLNYYKIYILVNTIIYASFQNDKDLFKWWFTKIITSMLIRFFLTFLTSKKITCFIDNFCFQNEMPSNYLFSEGMCTYILDFWPWRWSALRFVDKHPLRMQEQCFFFELGVVGDNFWSGWKNLDLKNKNIIGGGGLSGPYPSPLKTRRGEI